MLSDRDAALYREVFRLQDKGEWRLADRRIREIKDKVLMGHVLAQRYLHPTGYRSRFSELRDWLRHYADLPEAGRIYALALRRKPRGAAAPPRPRARFAVSSDNIDPTATDAPAQLRRRAGERHVYRHVAYLVKHIRLSQAERYLDESSVQRAAGTAGVDRARALVAAGWFRHGDTRHAFELASRAAHRSGAAAPRAQWWAGLTAFSLGRYDAAMGYFAAMAKSPAAGDADQAAAAFWAGRSALRGGRMAEVGPFLDRAARFDRAFYGLIAARIRGDAPRFDWRLPDISDADVVGFTNVKAGRRVLALVQVGEEERAGMELRALRVGASPKLLRTVITLADAADMPGASLRAGRVLLRATGQEARRRALPAAALDAGDRLFHRPRPDLRHRAPGIGVQRARPLALGRARPVAAHARDRALHGRERPQLPRARRAPSSTIRASTSRSARSTSTTCSPATWCRATSCSWSRPTTPGPATSPSGSATCATAPTRWCSSRRSRCARPACSCSACSRTCGCTAPGSARTRRRWTPLRPGTGLSM